MLVFLNYFSASLTCMSRLKALKAQWVSCYPITWECSLRTLEPAPWVSSLRKAAPFSPGLHGRLGAGLWWAPGSKSPICFLSWGYAKFNFPLDKSNQQTHMTTPQLPGEFRMNSVGHLCKKPVFVWRAFHAQCRSVPLSTALPIPRELVPLTTISLKTG